MEDEQLLGKRNTRFTKQQIWSPLTWLHAVYIFCLLVLLPVLDVALSLAQASFAQSIRSITLVQSLRMLSDATGVRVAQEVNSAYHKKHRTLLWQDRLLPEDGPCRRAITKSDVAGIQKELSRLVVQPAVLLVSLTLQHPADSDLAILIFWICAIAVSASAATVRRAASRAATYKLRWNGEGGDTGELEAASRQLATIELCLRALLALLSIAFLEAQPYFHSLGRPDTCLLVLGVCKVWVEVARSCFSLGKCLAKTDPLFRMLA